MKEPETSVPLVQGRTAQGVFLVKSSLVPSLAASAHFFVFRLSTSRRAKRTCRDGAPAVNFLTIN
jgi:hypothetical protein